MPKCKLVKDKDRTFETIAGPPGFARVGRDAHTDVSQTMSCGVVEMQNLNMPWTILYDEYFYVLEGSMTIQADGTDYVLEEGDGFWIPEGTELVYIAGEETCKMVVAVYPGNWREIHGIE